MSNRYGRNWLKLKKRLAILLRDQFRCVWCGQRLGERVAPTLDHLVPRCEFGKNHHQNLASACPSCNARRKNLDWQAWAYRVARRTGQDGTDIIRHIRQCLEWPLPWQQAGLILTHSPSWEDALKIAREDKDFS